MGNGIVIVFAASNDRALAWADEHAISPARIVYPTIGFEADRSPDAEYVIVPGYESGISLGETDEITRGRDNCGWEPWSAHTGNEHDWPGDLDGDARCQRCSLLYAEWSEDDEGCIREPSPYVDWEDC